MPADLRFGSETESLASLPARFSARFLLLILLASFAACCLAAYAVLEARGDAHASLVYVLLLHLLVLPTLLLYWNASRHSRIVSVGFGKLHLVVAVLFAAAALVVAFHLRHSGISDESAYKFQARIFAAGKLKAPPMPGATTDVLRTPSAIRFEQTIQRPDGWFSKYPPGWPLVLSAGYLLHCPWLVNPALGVIQLCLLWYLARRWGRNTQILAVVIAASSGFMLAFSTGFMSHASESVVTLLALCALLNGLEEHRLSRVTIAFLLVIVATQIRPYTGAVLGLFFAVLVLWEWKGKPRLLAPALAIITGCGLIAVAAFCLVNFIYTGSPLVTPYAMILGGSKVHELTFRPAEIAVGILHTWRWSITDTLRVTFPFMFLFAAYACWTETKQRKQLIYFAVLLPLLVLAYFLQSEGSGGSGAGERFYFEGFCPMAIVAARGLCLMMGRWKVQTQSVYGSLSVLLALQMGTAIFVVKWLDTQKGPYIPAYRAAHRNAPPLVFVDIVSPVFSARHANWNQADWQRARTVYLIDPGAGHRDEVACRFQRPIYRVVTETVGTGTVEYFQATAHCPAGQ